MKFLLDQSADFRLIPYLEDLGHDVQVISRHYPHGLPDEEVLATIVGTPRLSNTSRALTDVMATLVMTRSTPPPAPRGNGGRTMAPFQR